MMKKTVFECDVCHRQGPIVTRLKLELLRLFLANGNGEKPLTAFQPLALEADVCSGACAIAKTTALIQEHFTDKEIPACSEMPSSDITP
jgi:hypothetical protein